MKEQLESRERGTKREREEQEGEVEKFERELRRLAEDGKRRRKETEDALRKAAQTQNESGEAGTTTFATPAKATSSGCFVTEISRTIKVRFPRSGGSSSITKDSLISLFSIFGPVESAFLLKDKKTRLAPGQEKRLVGTGFIVFKSLFSAHAAVSEARVKSGFEDFDSVEWAEVGAKESDGGNGPETPMQDKAESTSSTPGSGYSFRKSEGSPFTVRSAPGSPNLLEATMMRLKEAQNNRRLSAMNGA